MKRTNDENQCPERVHSPPANDTRVVKLPFVENQSSENQPLPEFGESPEEGFQDDGFKVAAAAVDAIFNVDLFALDWFPTERYEEAVELELECPGSAREFIASVSYEAWQKR